MGEKIPYIKDLIFLLISITFISCTFKKEPIAQLKPEKNEVSVWIDSANEKSYSVKKRKVFLKRAYNLTASQESDSAKAKQLSNIAYEYLKLRDTLNFKYINNEANSLALKIGDTHTLGTTQWNYAYHYDNKLIYDSAYYHYNNAYKYFKEINHEYYTAKMLYNMGVIKGRFRDYTGSEALIIQAVSKYKTLKKYKQLYISYNYLAILQKELKTYDKALFYHEKAIEILRKLKNKGAYKEWSLNNIGVVHHNSGNFTNAIEYFNKALKNETLKIKDPKLYSRLIDNKAFSKLHNKDTTQIEKDFLKALHIRDSINNKGGVLINKLHLSEYYEYVGDTAKAIVFSREAYHLAKQIRFNRDYLTSLKRLSILDKENSEKYLNQYIKLNDSLQEADRSMQNKFARIAFETDEYIEETKRLSQQKILMLLIGAAIIMIISLIFFIRIQKTRNEKLILESKQQLANEKLYILRIRQQAKLEEEKTKERNRISEELHDGILGKLFGIRIDLGFLDIKGSKETLNKHEVFLKELQKIEKDIRDVSHKLQANFDDSNTNFVILIEALLKNKSKIGGFEYSLNSDNNINWNIINEKIRVNLYRILQESLQNIIKYAQAKYVSVDISVVEDKLVIKINDNGRGFNTKKIKKGIGIKNMSSRVQKLNGLFNIKSIINEGTSIEILIPVKNTI